MIIYFSGLHGIGKTTLIQKLFTEFLNPKTIGELDFDRYQTFRKNITSNQIDRLLDQRVHAVECSKSTHPYIADRGPWDQLCYTRAMAQYGLLEEERLHDIISLNRSLSSDILCRSVIVYLRMPWEQVHANILHRDRKTEINTFFAEKQFLQILQTIFDDFYAQLKYIRDVVIIDAPYTAETVFNVLWKNRWFHKHHLKPVVQERLKQEALEREQQGHGG